ncbi:condensin subunit ScpA [Sulfuritortus calidifontis]|uniref:Segregation and condensation protein A n=1 Tax=Sulfuritortus calidifontis TaxID=1914471 RepID=A0A4R3JXA7_9PROT|nr:condensin subunit ScpA [Sulfuritortus calidifontis]
MIDTETVAEAPEVAEATAAQAEVPAIARVLGQPWLELPQDLYIPPDALEVILDAFEGPLDLLLWLIRRNNIDVLDIPMAELTRQYIDYVEAMRRTRLDMAAEYLVMAAMLIEIKSRMLLPRPEKLEEGEEVDPRAELVRRLLEYEQMKKAAHNLNAAPLIGRDFMPVNVWVEKLAVRRLPQVNQDDLLAAWRDILKRASRHKHHRIGRQELSVREHMSRILKRLQESNYALFTDLFNPEAGRPELVVTFLALLELTRERLIDLVQNEPFTPIHARLAYTPTES